MSLLEKIGDLGIGLFTIILGILSLSSALSAPYLPFARKPWRRACKKMKHCKPFTIESQEDFIYNEDLGYIFCG